MLQSLTIESFAIIDQVTIDFTQGMTVLSGETGAGKSIIIDALGILCGGRGSNEFIRQDSEKLVVEGLFSFNEQPTALIQLLEELSIDTEHLLEDGLIIRREINNQGKNLIRVNGQLLNVTALKRIGSHLVDIHGQNEHQALLDNTQHLSLVDQLGDQQFIQLKEKYQTAYEQYAAIRRQWFKSQKNEQEQMQRLSFLEFQVNEIEAAHLVKEEYEQLEAISAKLQNATKITHAMESINYLMSDSDSSILGNLSEVIDELNQIKDFDDQYPAILDQVKSIQIDLQEIAHQVAMSNDGFDTGDQSIDEVEARLNELGQLKRKYGMEIDEILDYYDQISEEIYQVRNREAYLKDLALKFNTAYQEALTLAQQLTAERQKLAKGLVTAIEHELADLYMPHSRFEVRFNTLATEQIELDELGTVEWINLSIEGQDEAEFYAMTNVGEASKPLVKVASGGELSRFMLALKAVFSRQLSEHTMVFDEIDTGVSGRVAQAIAEKIAQIAFHNQVLCITHLAQVAAIAHEQLYIQKQVANNRTSTVVNTLTTKERREILAQMMSGKTITDSSLQMADDLLTEMARFKNN